MTKTLKEYSVKELLLKLPLYNKVEINWNSFEEKTVKNQDWDNNYNEIYEFETYEINYTEDFEALIDFFNHEYVIAGVCPSCKKNITLSVDKIKLDDEVLKKCVRCYHENQIDDDDAYIPEPEYVMKKRIGLLMNNGGYFDKLIHCTICHNIHRISFKLINDIDKSGKLYLMKIGQYPSLKSFSEHNTREYDKLLMEIKSLEDYKSAHHMEAEGYHVAAFTYLRRVFENFISYKFNEVQNELDNTVIKLYKNKRMDDKIDSLKDYLPVFLLNNTELYSVISAGIHSLTEEECEAYFSAINDALDVILLEEMQIRARKKFEINASKRVKQANSKIKEKTPKKVKHS